ncbi:MAG: integrase [Rhodothermales bacterium]|jgi:integrase
MSRRNSPTISLGRGFSYRLHRNTFRLRIYDRGRVPKEKTVSLNTDSPSLAALRAADYYQRFTTCRWSPWDDAVSYVSIGEALARYEKERRDLRERTRYDLLWTVRRCLEPLGLDTGIESVRPADIRPFIQRPDIRQATMASYYRKLQAFFGWCQTVRIIEESPLEFIPRPAEPQVLPNGLTQVELARLLGVARDREAGLVGRYPNPSWASNAFELLAWTGLRPAEGARLEWADIHERVILVRTRSARTKTDRERAVTIVPQARRVLERLPRDSPYVLPGGQGGKLYVSGLSRRFALFRDLAELPKKYTLYSMRHTFAAEYRRRGGSLVGLQYELGHKTIKTTEKYGHLGLDERIEYTCRTFSDPTP